MKVKPRVCIVDEDESVRASWQSTLSRDVEYLDFGNFTQLLDYARANPQYLAGVDCLICARFFQDNTVDIFEGSILDQLREQGVKAVFLNWQGYLTKDEINTKFDGRLFNRYGVRWQTLRSRMQKVKTRKVPLKKATSAESAAVASPKKEAIYQSKPQRCQELLLEMSRRAGGRHRDKLQHYAEIDHKNGIALLEALYNRLLIAKESSSDCPSRYINSSPVVAKNILHQALFG
jgi:hypothetical protein